MLRHKTPNKFPSTFRFRIPLSTLTIRSCRASVVNVIFTSTAIAVARERERRLESAIKCKYAPISLGAFHYCWLPGCVCLRDFTYLLWSAAPTMRQKAKLGGNPSRRLRVSGDDRPPSPEGITVSCSYSGELCTVKIVS